MLISFIKRSGSHLLSHGLAPQYPRPDRSLPSCSGWERVSPLSASPPDLFILLPHLSKPTTINAQTLTSSSSSFRKEVIQPHLPIRLPCYDFTPVTDPAVDCSLLRWVTGFGRYRLPWCDGRCVQDPGTYSPQHADLRLLAIPASCSRVADYNPNWDVIFGVCSPSRARFPLFTPL